MCSMTVGESKGNFPVPESAVKTSLSKQQIDSINSTLSEFFEAYEQGDVKGIVLLLPRLKSAMQRCVAEAMSVIPEFSKIINENNAEKLFEHAELELKQLENSNSKKIFDIGLKILGVLSLVVSVAFFVAAPSPATATFLLMSAFMLVDSLVAEGTGNPSLVGSAMTKSVELMDSLDGLDWLGPVGKNILSALIVISAVVLISFVVAKGGMSIFNQVSTTAATQSANMQLFSGIVKATSCAAETGQIGGQMGYQSLQFANEGFRSDMLKLTSSSETLSADLDFLEQTLQELMQELDRLNQIPN